MQLARLLLLALSAGSLLVVPAEAQNIEITAIELHDLGLEMSPSTGADVVRTDCGAEADDEPFEDSFLKISVLNEGLRTLRVVSGRYRVRDSDGAGTPFRSRRLASVSALRLLPDQTTDVAIPFLDIRGDAKHFIDSDNPVSPLIGFETVRVILVLRDSTGRRYRLRARTTFSFDEVDRCL